MWKASCSVPPELMPSTTTAASPVVGASSATPFAPADGGGAPTLQEPRCEGYRVQERRSRDQEAPAGPPSPPAVVLGHGDPVAGFRPHRDAGWCAGISWNTVPATCLPSC